MDHDFVLRELSRCLRSEGVSIHLFPIIEVLWECHAHMPLVHRIRNLNRRASLIYFFARLGFNRSSFRVNNLCTRNSLKEIAHKSSKVLEIDTNYISSKELRNIAKRFKLHISFCYTKNFFFAKLLSYLGRRHYFYHDMGFIEKLFFYLFRRLFSVTVLLRRMT